MEFEIIEDMPQENRIEVFSQVKGDGKAPVDSQGNPVDTSQYKQGGNVDWNAIVNAGADIAGALAASGVLTPNEQKQALRAICGNKPWFGKDKKEAYRQCAEDFYRSMGMNAGTPPVSTAPDGRNYYYAEPEDSGMSTGAKVAIGLGVAALLGVGIYFAVKSRRK